MDTKQAAQNFLEKYARLDSISAELAPMDKEIAEDDFFTSAHLEARGQLSKYETLSAERSQIASALKQIRSEAGDDALLEELKKMQGHEKALEYIHRVPLREDIERSELHKEVRKGLFGRFR